MNNEQLKTQFNTTTYSKVLFFVLALCIFHFAFFTSIASAATISFVTPQTIVGTSEPFALELTMDAKLAINALELVVTIPVSLEFVDASDGGSIISMWVKRPYMNDKHQLVLSGIIPGGFSGSAGRLVLIHLKAGKTGNASVAIDQSSRAYTNTINATPDPIVSKSVTFSVKSGVINKDLVLEDSISPESFTPIIGRISTSTTELATTSGQSDAGSWRVAFNAQDKGSGIARYEVAESKNSISLDDKEKLASIDWHEAQSPYILTDQTLSSYIYVKAIDQKSNEQIEIVSPQNKKWYSGPIGYILITILALLGLYVIAHHYMLKKRRFIS